MSNERQTFSYKMKIRISLLKGLVHCNYILTYHFHCNAQLLRTIGKPIMQLLYFFYDVLTGDVSCKREAKLEAAPRELTPNPDEVAPPVTEDD